MNVENIWWSESLGGFDYCAAKHREALSIVHIIAMTITIKSVTIAKFRMVDKVELHSVVLSAVYDLAKEQVVLHWNREVRNNELRFLQVSSPVARQENCEFMTQCRKRFWKSANNIGKTTGFRVRYSLRRGKRDSQPKLLQLGFATDPSARDFPRWPENPQYALSTEKNREAKAKRRV